jgi:hypothetical protein
MGSLGKLLFAIFIVVLVVVAGPWFFIWALNTLMAASMAGAPAGAFVPHIAFGFWTWLAAAVAGGFAILPFSRRS